MNNRKLFLGFVLLLGLFGAASAFQKPNFSGKWELDKLKSFSNPAGLEQSATITQAGDQITFDTKVKTGNNPEQKLTENYTLDGKEGAFKPAAPPNATGKRTASWLPNGRGLLIKDETSVDGKIVSTVTRKWTLASDGKTLTVDYYIDRPTGTFESKRVFNKVD